MGKLCFGSVGPKIKNCIIDRNNIKCEETNIPFKTILSIFYHYVQAFLS